MLDSDFARQILQEKDAFQKAKLLQQVMLGNNIALKQIAADLKMKPSYICHYLRLLRLPEIVIDGYYNRQISASHLFTISRLKRSEDMLSVYERVLANNLSAKQTDDLVREVLFSITPTKARLSTTELKDLHQRLLTEFPQAIVKIRQTRVKGSIFIEVSGNTTATSKFIRDFIDKLTYQSTRTYKSEPKITVLE